MEDFFSLIKAYSTNFCRITHIISYYQVFANVFVGGKKIQVLFVYGGDFLSPSFPWLCAFITSYFFTSFWAFTVFPLSSTRKPYNYHWSFFLFFFFQVPPPLTDICYTFQKFIHFCCCCCLLYLSNDLLALRVLYHNFCSLALCYVVGDVCKIIPIICWKSFSADVEKVSLFSRRSWGTAGVCNGIFVFSILLFTWHRRASNYSRTFSRPLGRSVPLK